MLTGRRVVVTRAREKADALAACLEQRGAEVIFCPTIRYLPPQDAAGLEQARREAWDWVLFTSPQGVAAFFAPGPVDLGRARVACIGPSTAAALPPGLACDVLPQRYVAEGLLEALQAHPMQGQRVLLPRAAEAREILPQTLSQRGALVQVVAAYRTVPETALNPQVLQGAIDALTFTASSTVKGFVELLQGRRPLSDFPVVAIGPITAATARDLGFVVLAEADTHTIEGLIQALEAVYVS